MNSLSLARALLFVSACACVHAAWAAVPADAETGIGRINADWGPAMQNGDADTILAAYAPDAVFCSGDGRCYSGLENIAAMTRARLAAHGPAKHATAHTTQMVQDHGFIYEWGQAEIVSAEGKTSGGGYFTIWRKQRDGHWKIFRNIVLP
jgi:uncharacterized protein (TIGR02246 family)